MRVIECPKCKASLDNMPTDESQVVCSYCRTTIDLSEPKRVNSVQNIQVNLGTDVDVDTLLEKGFILLEERQWEKAERQFKRVINASPKNAQSYVGLLLVNRKMTKEEDLVKSRIALSGDANYRLAVRFADADLKKRLEGYDEIIRKIENQSEKEAWSLWTLVLGIPGGLFWAEMWFILFSSWTDDFQLINFRFLNWTDEPQVGVSTYVGLTIAYLFGILLAWSIIAKIKAKELKKHEGD